jgi:hypothetical protein
MKRFLVCVLLCAMACVVDAAPYTPSSAEAALMKRAFVLTGKASGFLFRIPSTGDLGPSIGTLVGTAVQARKHRQPLIIYSPDAQRATRVTTIALAAVRPNALSGLAVICAVGAKNDNYVRPVVEATGAKLYVEPLP